MTQSYTSDAALTRPEDNSKVTPKQLQDNLKKETLKFDYALEKRWKKFKHWTKIVIFFIFVPLAIIAMLLTWFVSFLAINWHNPSVIMQKSGTVLSYIFTIIVTSAVTHYVEKK